MATKATVASVSQELLLDLLVAAARALGPFSTVFLGALVDKTESGAAKNQTCIHK